MALCPDCVSGSVRQGTPTGRIETIHGLPCYIAEPPSGEPNGVVVIIPDAFGWEFVNNKILADNYAKKGNFRVLLPDFMDGHGVSAGVIGSMGVLEDENAWFFSRALAFARFLPIFFPFLVFNRQSVALPRIENFFRELRASTSLRIGAAGFCWGGRYVALLCSGQQKAKDGTTPLLDCGFTAHPSNLVLPGEIEAVKLPLSIAHASKDFMLGPPQAEMVQKILERKNSEFDCEFVVYEGAKHGFGVRIHEGDEHEAKAGEGAEDQAVAFFTKHLGRGQ